MFNHRVEKTGQLIESKLRHTPLVKQQHIERVERPGAFNKQPTFKRHDQAPALDQTNCKQELFERSKNTVLEKRLAAAEKTALKAREQKEE